MLDPAKTPFRALASAPTSSVGSDVSLAQPFDLGEKPGDEPGQRILPMTPLWGTRMRFGD
jgi:hypothetical protein